MKTLGDQMRKLKGTTIEFRFEVYEIRKNFELKKHGSRKDMLGAMKLLRKAKINADHLAKEFRVVKTKIIEERETSYSSEPYLR